MCYELLLPLDSFTLNYYHMRKIYIAVSLVLLGASVISNELFAQNYPAGFAQQSAGGGLLVQTASAFAPDGRIFVAEQTGRIRIIKNGATLATPFASLTVDASGERGLLGIAVDPDFLTNKFIYVYHTVPAAGGAQPYNRVIKLNATNDVVSGTPQVVLNLEPLTSNIHNAGAMHFGRDKKLYIAVGENARPSTAQDLTNYGGKLLRINTDGSAPSDNPFFSNTNDKAKRVWALGLRNPFTFSIDQETGKIFVNDVGQGAWEEINDATVAGRNFGWPSTEGRFLQSSFPSFTNPVYAYPHPAAGAGYSDGIGCAIVGGAFVSPSNTNYPAQYRGKYFFQDNCANWINMLDLSTGTAVRSPFATAVTQNSLGLTMGIDGRLYFSARHHQALYRIVYNNTSVPTITNHPVNASVAVGQPVSFSVTALGTPPLTYQWQKNNVNIQGATGTTYSIPQAALSDNGATFRVIVSNNTGSTATSNAATLTVINNLLPVAEILTPVAGTTYVAGSTVISFSGKGTDPEQGNLPASSMSWGINFHHDTHHHDQPPINGVASGTFTPPAEGETSNNVWYRIILTVTDNFGLKSKDSVDVFPMKSTMTFATSPPGLQITVDGQPFNTPGSVVGVEGVRRELGVISPQSLNNQTYEFQSWSDGGSQTHSIVTPTDDKSYTANFVLSEKTFYRAINIFGDARTIDGNNWEASASAANFSFSGATYSNQTISLIPPTDANRAAMIRSCIWGSPSVTITNVPNGNYQIYLYTWEDNFSSTYSLTVEGSVVLSNASSGPAGTWKKSGPFAANITDGTINAGAIGPDATFSGIEIWKVEPVGSSPTVTNPLVDQSADVDEAFTYTFAANSFTPGEAGATLVYSATLSNDNPLPSWLGFVPATRTFSGTPGTAHIGSLDIKVVATEGTASVSDVFKLTVTGPQTAAFYRAININGGALSIDGRNWEAGNAPNVTTVGFTYANQSIPTIPTTDANRANMIRSLIWGSPSVAIAGVPAGSYQIWVYTFEDNFSSTYSLSVEGATVLSNAASGPGGTWKKSGPYIANITDGTINVGAIGPDATISGIEIWTAGQPSSPPTLTNPLVDQTATAGTAFSYAFALNTFSPGQPGATLAYSADLSNGSPLPSWLTFNSTNRTFSGTPNNTHAGFIDIRVVATEGASSVSDIFRLTVNASQTNAFYRAINLFGPALTIDGNQFEASAGAPNFTSFGATYANQSIPLIPTASGNLASMIRSCIWGNPSIAVSNVPAGTYQIYVYTWEDNFSSTYSLAVEGTTVLSNAASGPGGTWKKSGPFPVSLTDGTINISAIGPDATISGIEIWSGSQNAGSSSARYAAEALSEDLDGDGLDLSFYPNPFSEKVTVEFTAKVSAPTTVAIYDMRGIKTKTIFEGSVLSGHKAQYEVDPSSLSDGIYILEMINGHESKRLKMMLVR